jgi:hypothetical protein
MHQVEVKDQKMAEDAPKGEAYKQLVDSTCVFNFQKFCTKSNRTNKTLLRDIASCGQASSNKPKLVDQNR